MTMDNINGWTKFDSWDELVGYARSGGKLYYWRPLDYSPATVTVRTFYKNGKMRLRCLKYGYFTADESHIDRFRFRSYPPAHNLTGGTI